MAEQKRGSWLARRIVAEVFSVLRGRSHLFALDRCEDDIRAEIRAEAEAIVDALLAEREMEVADHE